MGKSSPLCQNYANLSSFSFWVAGFSFSFRYYRRISSDLPKGINVYRILWTLFVAFGLVTKVVASSNDEKIPAKPVLMQAHIFEQQGSRILALSYQNKPHWHTYWKNPGDAGLAFKNEFTSDGKPIELEELEWPAPKIFIAEGDILGFGYENEYSLFYKVPKNLSGQVDIKSSWLVCKHICIPGKGNINANITKDHTGLVGTEEFKLSTEKLKSRLSELPKEVEAIEGFKIELVKGDEPKSLKLAYEFQGEKAPTSEHYLVSPFLKVPFDFKRETLHSSADSIKGVYTIAWDGEYEEPAQNLTADGSLPQEYELSFLVRKPSSSEVFKITKKFKEAKAQPSFGAIAATVNTTQSGPAATIIESEAGSAQTSLLAIFLFAFLGGLILNIMPCVLPVISLKLFGLLRHAGESKKQIFRHNIFYSLGVITTFLLLAASVLIIKATGEAVGWGFQLQSPLFVAIMAIIIFVMALNLFGLFEFATPGGRKLGGVTLKDSFIGDFFGGVLATILSTPCSAPLLGTALTFAFSNGPIEIIATFLMIGLGLSSPFLLTAFFPSLIRFLPKPGMWMESVKKFLGLILVLTTLWLLDVFGALVDGSTALLKLQTSLVFIFFAIYGAKKIFKSKMPKIAFALIPVLIFVSLFSAPLSTPSGANGSAMLIDKQKGGLPWEEWSEVRMNELRGKGERVFIDFTAKWCFTCKVNEKLVLDTGSFKELQQKYDAKLLLADWTKKDPMITSFLEKNNLVGVPAYFVIDSTGQIHNLGETITISKIEKALSL